MDIDHCEYTIGPLPPHNIYLCNAYYKNKTFCKRKNTHFPCCKEKNCPMIHPELMGGENI